MVLILHGGAPTANGNGTQSRCLTPPTTTTTNFHSIFFTREKNGNGHLCLSPFAGLAQVLSLGRSPRTVAGVVASAAGGQSGHALGMSECQKQLRSRELSLSGFSSPHSPFWLYSQPNFLESCKACPRRAAWCISFLGIQPTFTQVPPRPEKKATVNIPHVLV